MQEGPRVPIVKSIATRLLVAVFSVYVVITLALTGLHMAAEYSNTKHSVLQEIVALAVTFNPGLATAIYNVDTEGIESMVEGMVLDPNVTGALVRTEFQGSFSAGAVPAEEPPPFRELDVPGLTQVEVEGFTATVPIHYQERAGEGFDIGLLTLYSSESVVLSKVWFALGIILVNAAIKTVALWIIFLWFSRRYLSRPLARLTEATSRVRLHELGRHKVDLGPRGQDELHLLAEAFNTMIDTLAESYSESDALNASLVRTKAQLEEYNRTLEQRVEQRTEELREAKEAAEKATAVKSTFLANMSHEIRSPMNVVLGMTDLLGESGPDKEQRRLLGIQRRAGENLLRLIDDILDLSKVEAGQVELEHIPFDPRDMIETLCKGEAAKAHAKGVELVCRVAPSVPPLLRGDPTRLGQVLQNLLGNAVKFTERGEVVLDIRPVDGGGLRFQVSDTGIGIAPDKQGTIFNTFAQADTSTTRKYGGTGLGLTICRQLVQLMGGAIELRSAQGEGTAFSFTLELEEAPAPKLPAPPPNLAATTALLVMPNDSARAALAEQLVHWGARVVEACSGKELHEEALRLGPEGLLVFVCQELPDMPGLEALSGLGPVLGALRGRAALLVRSTGGVPRTEAAALGVRVYVRPIGGSDLADLLGARESGRIRNGEGGGGA
ncbi:MAG: ATP-binding protein [Desulfovibrionaceae bacterium]